MVVELIKLSKTSDQPLYLQLYNQLHEMIKNRQIPADYKLPPIRKLAKKLGINNVTVVNAYKLLESDGLVYSKIGSGTYVTDLENKELFEGNSVLEESSDFEEVKLINQGQIEIGENTINFASATPTPELFPVDDFKNALNEVLDRDKGLLLATRKVRVFIL